MKFLIVGYDVDLGPIQRQLSVKATQEVFFVSIAFPAASYDPNTLFENVPKTVDAIVFVYSDAAHCSTQLSIFYGLVRSNFASEKKYNCCLESFKEKHKLGKDIDQIDLEQLELMVGK